MLALAQTSSKQVSRTFVRSYSEIVVVKPKRVRVHRPRNTAAGPSKPLEAQTVEGASTTETTSKSSSSRRVPVKEDHGLYGFFRRKAGDDLKGEARFEVFDTPENAQVLTGRAWRAAELRNKSFKDLHTLWYVGLREKNLLASQKEEVRRMGVTNSSMQVSIDKVRNCRKTMGRIKAVLNERRLAYLGAVEIAETERVAALGEIGFGPEDEEVLKYQRANPQAEQHGNDTEPLSKPETTPAQA
ncbi:mitochondrial 39-S ribosomal protein L47 (MRP-L47)-domain-containing protein [Crassisporium funariophilum]|nr:mitochondrial 39-S ribosomal protein L47 (MRP-L47)-domain-containing protein [Crassisporium funariophilum]